MSSNKTPSRIYRLDTGHGDRLVRASSRAQAVHHVTASMPVRVATQDDIANLVAEGIKVETAGEQSPQMVLGVQGSSCSEERPCTPCFTDKGPCEGASEMQQA